MGQLAITVAFLQGCMIVTRWIEPLHVRKCLSVIRSNTLGVNSDN